MISIVSISHSERDRLQKLNKVRWLLSALFSLVCHQFEDEVIEFGFLIQDPDTAKQYLYSSEVFLGQDAIELFGTFGYVYQTFTLDCI